MNWPQIVRTEDARAVYLIDIDTDEIIYMNKYAKEMLQRPVDDESYHGANAILYCRDWMNGASSALTRHCKQRIFL